MNIIHIFPTLRYPVTDLYSILVPRTLGMGFFGLGGGGLLSQTHESGARYMWLVIEGHMRKLGENSTDQLLLSRGTLFFVTSNNKVRRTPGSVMKKQFLEFSIL